MLPSTRRPASEAQTRTEPPLGTKEEEDEEEEEEDEEDEGRIVVEDWGRFVVEDWGRIVVEDGRIVVEDGRIVVEDGRFVVEDGRGEERLGEEAEAERRAGWCDKSGNGETGWEGGEKCAR